MKKLYLEEKWKRHSASRQKKSEKQKLRIHKQRSPKKRFHNEDDVHLNRDSATIDAPNNFSIVSNTVEMLGFFKKAEALVRSNYEIYLNLSNVTNITADAILYTLSRINHFKNVYQHIKIRGNRPNDSKCREKLEDSGFFDYVYTMSKLEKVNSDVYKIKSFENVEPIIAKEIVDFSKAHIKDVNILDSKGVYATLIECMANTHNHAYEKNKHVSASNSRWWLMAEHDKQNNETTFVFLDNGYGIPKTIRKNFKEKIKQDFLPIRNMDCRLILSSLHGDFRTKTGKKNRGKGLPRIYKFSKSGCIKDLKIISKKAYIECSEDTEKAYDMDDIFYGTLLTWSFR